MKSAFDLAMERFGGPIKELTEEKKKKIAEIEKRLKSKLAEAEIAKEKKLKQFSGDITHEEQILKDYAVEVASLNSKFEKEKDKVREE